MRSTTRWVRFNLVGVAGFAVQLLTLAAVTRWLGVETVVAIPIAVLVAVSHNFLWHERVTWPGQRRDGRLHRWLSFNLSNGLISVATNVMLTAAIIAATDTPLLVANATAVVMASVLNFLVSDRYIFRTCVFADHHGQRQRLPTSLMRSTGFDRGDDTRVGACGAAPHLRRFVGPDDGEPTPERHVAGRHADTRAGLQARPAHARQPADP